MYYSQAIVRILTLLVVVFCRSAEYFTEAVVQLPLAALPQAGKLLGVLATAQHCSIAKIIVAP